MSFEDNTDRISTYSVKSTNFTKWTYKSNKKKKSTIYSINIGTRL